MKASRTLAALILTLTLLMSLSVPAFGVNAQYPTTREFLAALDERGLKYTWVGVDSDGDEKVTVEFSGENKDSISVNIFFGEDYDVVNMRIWNLIDFNAADYVQVLEACNELHENYKFVTFYVDKTDWSVTAKLDLPIREGESCGAICIDGLRYLVNITDTGYDTLKAFAKEVIIYAE